ncbi:MAG: hypothetical protein LUG60_05480 [Erysipelotrichaceae bacterium]|nr:hypothetical protein [Erysipelotrichaceae bacterium]
MEQLIETNLKKKKLEELLQDAASRSDRFSITRYFDDYMSEDEYNMMQKEFMDAIMEDHRRRVNAYENNIDGYYDELNKLFYFKNDNDAKSYFDELLNQDIEAYQSIQYIEFENKKPSSLKIPEEYLIERKLTRISPVTTGPVFEIYTFSMEAFDDIKATMKKLFSSYKIYGGIFEDLCLYNGNQSILKICSHEGYAYFDKKDA